MADAIDNEPKHGDDADAADAKHVTEMMGSPGSSWRQPPAAGPAKAPPATTALDRLRSTRSGGADGTRPQLTMPHPSKPLSYALGAIIVLALGFGGGWLGAASHGDDSQSPSKQTVVLKGQAALISGIAKNVGQSVVSVNVTAQTADTGLSSFFGFNDGGGSGSQTEQSAGTGIILSSDGLIMTNRHVVPEGTTNVSITLSDGTIYDDVQVVGRTRSTDSLDVAFLKVQDTKGRKLVPASIGDSASVKVGDPVVAIGNALGQFQNTVTSGIISGYGRSLQASASDGSSSENLEDLFQTDAAINEGNSGGPLVNLDGQVIGMNTALATDSQSIGFSIPINDLSGLIESVKTTGKLQRPYMGVVYVPITADVAKQYGLKVDKGAYIPTTGQNNGSATVISGGPADKAGLKPGDIITKVNGTDIDQSTSLVSLLDKHKVGDSVSLTIVRGSGTITKNVTLEAAPSS
ncbi:MAG TPA: trypsin-like peptidase domain-containing protein [Candidatus Saccharimonadales bacterium]|nr:trypsin-like peptidase domain-containing protein [Candidatus Saccharimonadales bacterium]